MVLQVLTEPGICYNLNKSLRMTEPCLGNRYEEHTLLLIALFFLGDFDESTGDRLRAIWLVAA